MSELLKRMRDFMSQPLDISEHLGLLRGLAMDPGVHSIVEIGFRTGVSATALASADKPLTCYDIEPCRDAARKLQALAPKFSFVQADSLKIEIPHCELLHIDSLHTYNHLKQELDRHHGRCRKWIALHDTETFAAKGKDGSKPGLQAAVSEFLFLYGLEWKLHLHLTNCNGLTLLRRKS